MAVDNREVNMQSEPTISIHTSHLYFNVWVVNNFFVKVVNIQHGLSPTPQQNTAQNTAIITPWGVSLFGISIWYLNCPGLISGMADGEGFNDYYQNGAIVYIDDTDIYRRDVEGFLGIVVHTYPFEL